MLRAALSPDDPRDAGGGHQVALVGAVDEDPGREGALGRPQRGDPGPGFFHHPQGATGDDGDAGLLKHPPGDAARDARFEDPTDPGGLVLRVVRGRSAAGDIVLRDPRMPLLEEAREGFPAHLVGITVAEPAGAESAEMRGRLEQDDLGAFPGRRDGGAEAPGRRAVDEDVGRPRPVRPQQDGQEGEAARAPHQAQATRALTTLEGRTPVSFWSSPWYL